MHVRDFLRGGYKEIKEPTVITRHGRVIATWLPSWVGYMLVETKVGAGETTKNSSR